MVLKIVGDSSSLQKELVKADRGVHRFTRDIDKAGRGALAGSGVFRSFGRSIAFASGGFLAFASATQFLRASVDAAREAGVAHRALAAQMKASGESFDANREKIEKASLAYGKFGFQNDEVIASLTVLERGTGNINKAISLQGLTADLARAKNLDLSKAAQTVAKVFGGQETALRRAVPGLHKSAHGWDLIREAQQKLAGQAAANTTAAERFQATLHDTEEIIGGALLPILNKYLNSLSRWLNEMNRSGKLQRDVASAADFLSQAFSALKAIVTPFIQAFRGLSAVLGGTRKALLFLAAAFAAFKFVQLINYLHATAAAVGLIGTTATGSAVKVGVLGRAMQGIALLGGAGALGVGAIAGAGIAGLYMQQQAQAAAEEAQKAAAAALIPGSKLETTLVPKIAKQISAMMAKGMSAAEILPRLKAQLGGSLKADDIIAEAFALRAGQNPELEKRIQAAAAGAVTTTDKALAKEAKKEPSVKLRNQWFDARIERMISRSQTGGLRAQLGRLQDVAAMVGKRIAATKDITRKLNLEDKLLQVQAQARDLRKQIAQNFLNALEFNVTKAGATATLSDDIAALLKLQAYLRRRAELVGSTLEIQQKQLDVTQQLKQVREQRMQNFLDALQFNVEKAGATVRLSDDLRALRVLAGVLKQRIAAEKGNLDLQRQLLGVQSQINDVLKQQAQRRQEAAQRVAEATAARQMRLLGLDPSGSPLVPGVKALQKEVDALEKSLAGTLLGKQKKGLLDRIEKILMGRLGKVSKNVRQAIKGLLDEIRGQLDEVPAMVTSSAFAAPPGINGAAVISYAGVGGYTINNLNLYGVQDVPGFENQLKKRANQRPQPRRGQ